jgi:DNA-directed RNA polymerase subunit RPC12/RpoP
MGSHPAYPAAKCPACRSRMAPMDRSPILFTDCLVDVTYICERCGTEAKCAVREPLKLSQADHDRSRHRIATP